MFDNNEVAIVETVRDETMEKMMTLSICHHAQRFTDFGNSFHFNVHFFQHKLLD